MTAGGQSQDACLCNSKRPTVSLAVQYTTCIAQPEITILSDYQRARRITTKRKLYYRLTIRTGNSIDALCGPYPEPSRLVHTKTTDNFLVQRHIWTPYSTIKIAKSAVFMSCPSKSMPIYGKRDRLIFYQAMLTAIAGKCLQVRMPVKYSSGGGKPKIASSRRAH